MNIRKIIIGQNGQQDIVVLQNGERFYWSSFLRMTELSVKAVRTAFDTATITPDAQAGHRWLTLCGITNRKEFEDLEKHLPQLRGVMDATNTRLCRKCWHPIWGKESLLTGIGSECRRKAA